MFPCLNRRCLNSELPQNGVMVEVIVVVVVIIVVVIIVVTLVKVVVVAKLYLNRRSNCPFECPIRQQAMKLQQNSHGAGLYPTSNWLDWGGLPI